jgi:uncharacterized lipoprotein YmbA
VTRRALALALAALVAACTSPNPALYTLASTPGPAVRTAVRSVELRRVGLAGYLDRPEIVRSSADYRVQVYPNDRWSESPSSMLERVFTEDLVQRLPGTSVFAESGAISTSPDAVIEVDILRFDADADGTIVLLAQVAMRHADASAPAVARTVRLTTRPASPATRDHVAAMSTALGELADRVANQLADFRPHGRG